MTEANAVPFVPMSKNPPIALMLLPVPLVIGTVIGLVVGFATGSWLWGIVALILVALAIGLAAFYMADSLALRLLKARPLAEGGSKQLRNQLEELCARTGVAEPDLYTVGTGSPAIASFGRKTPALVVTDGLSDELTVVELEAAVARELGRAQSGSTTIDTLAVSFLTLPLAPLGNLGARALRFFRGGDHDAQCDLDGISITRYPPGMTAALSKMPAIPPGLSRAVSHLWAVDDTAERGTAGTFSIDERLELLREL